MRNLITPSEIIRYSDLDLNMPVCDFRQIAQIEAFIFGTKFNNDLYKALIADLVDYSTTETFKTATSYVVDDTALYNGIYYTCVEDCVGVLPTNKDKWELAPKFGSDCFNELWCEVLAQYIAYVIIENRLPKLWVKIKAEGIIKMKGDSFDSVTQKDFTAVQGSIIKDIEISHYNLIQYINNTDCLSSYYIGCSKEINYDTRGEYEVG